jgi:hypothetical protein
MAELPSDPNSAGDETGIVTGAGSTPSTPGWVQVFGIFGVALVLLIAILHLTGHSLRDHRSSSGVTVHRTEHP